MASFQTQGPPAEQMADLDNGEKIDLLDALILFAENRRRVLALTFLGLVIGIILALVIRPTFTASALILPPQQQHSSASALMGELGSLAGLSGGGGTLGVKSPADMYVGILESRTIADGLIKKFHLENIYHKKNMVDARNALKKHVKIVAGKDGLISISVDAHDPGLASDLANGYVSGLYSMNSRLAITEAAQRRVFFDQQLNEEKSALTAAEDAFKNMQEKTGLIQLSGQAESIIRSIAELNAQIANREVELEAMKTFATDQNPNLIRTQQEIDALRGQLQKLEVTQSKMQPGNIEIPTGKVPEATLEYARKLRDLKFHETLYELLAKQYESARMDEAKSAPVIQVVDRAVPPPKKSGPSRTLIALGGLVAGFILGCFWALWRRSLGNLRSNPERAAKLHRLRLTLRG